MLFLNCLITTLIPLNLVPPYPKLAFKGLSEYLKELSHDLLNLAQAFSEPAISNFDYINLFDITKDSIEYFKKTFLDDKDLQIAFQNNGVKQAITYCDSSRIRLVINNLLSNAIKYGDTKVITVDLVLTNNNQKNYWQLNITDQGIGIPEGDLDNIFKPFLEVQILRHYLAMGLV